MLNTIGANCTIYVAPFVISIIQLIGVILYQLYVVASDLQFERVCPISFFGSLFALPLASGSL